MQKVSMNELARQINAVLERHAVSPTPILVAQCRYLRKTPDTIDRDDLPKLAMNIGRAVALFSNPDKGRAVSDAIQGL